MIVRSWRGATPAADADEYVEYVNQTGVRAYRATEGNLGAAILRRTVGDRVEFVVVSLWDSPESIQGFAGPDIERAVFYPEDDRFLVDRDLYVTHYEVAFSDFRPLLSRTERG